MVSDPEGLTPMRLLARRNAHIYVVGLCRIVRESPLVTVANGVVAAIGHTPLIKLRRASEETGCAVLGKAEFMNPGQSVKDRAGLHMILEAEKRGRDQAGRPGGRGHRRQHRHRAGAGRRTRAAIAP